MKPQTRCRAGSTRSLRPNKLCESMVSLTLSGLEISSSCGPVCSPEIRKQLVFS